MKNSVLLHVVTFFNSAEYSDGNSLDSIIVMRGAFVQSCLVDLLSPEHGALTGFWMEEKTYRCVYMGICRTANKGVVVVVTFVTSI